MKINLFGFVVVAATWQTIAYIKDTALTRYNVKQGVAAQKQAMDEMFPDTSVDFDSEMKTVPNLIDDRNS
jgi:hypothetical protein